jgi:HD superfamily phosphodiesterase
MEKMIDYFGHDAKRINHALKVLSFAQIIAKSQSFDDTTNGIIGYAAILHDIGIKEAESKHQSTDGKYQELEGPPLARQMLSELKISENIIDRVCFIIGNHHSYSKIDGLDFQILVEADFIVNIFEDAMQADVVESIGKRIFKTDSGKKLLRTMYGNH